MHEVNQLYEEQIKEGKQFFFSIIYHSAMVNVHVKVAEAVAVEKINAYPKQTVMIKRWLTNLF